jgi:hypothetical protein
MGLTDFERGWIRIDRIRLDKIDGKEGVDLLAGNGAKRVDVPFFGPHSCISGTIFLPFYVVSTRFFGLALGFLVLPSVLCLLARRAGRSQIIPTRDCPCMHARLALGPHKRAGAIHGWLVRRVDFSRIDRLVPSQGWVPHGTWQIACYRGIRSKWHDNLQINWCREGARAGPHRA